MRLLLDTCAVLFFAEKATGLSQAAYAAIEAPDSEVFVSPVTPMELACLVDRKRILLKTHWRHWWHRVVEMNGWVCLPITGPIAEEAYCLPEPIHRDPCDRLLIATARLEGLVVVSADRLILGYPHVRALA